MSISKRDIICAKNTARGKQKRQEVLLARMYAARSSWVRALTDAFKVNLHRKAILK